MELAYHPKFSIFSLIPSGNLWNNEMAFQTIFWDFMMQFQNVVCDDHHKTFHAPHSRNLRKSKYSFVYVKVTSAWMERLTRSKPLSALENFYHFFSLFRKIFGHFQLLDPIF